MCPTKESVIWPIIMFLNEPVTAMKPATNRTPMTMRDRVSRVLLLYLKRFLPAILMRLPMAVSSPVSIGLQDAVFHRVNGLRLADDA